MAPQGDSENAAPTIVAYFAAMPLSQLMQQDSDGKRYLLMGSMYFSLFYWLFLSGGLIGFGLRNNPELLFKFLFHPKTEEDFVWINKYFKDTGNALISEYAGGFLTYTKSEAGPTNINDLFVVPSLLRVGIDLRDGEFFIGEKRDWIKEKEYDFEVVDKYSYLSFRQGVSLGYCYPDIFQRCWLGSNIGPSKDKWEEAFKLGIVDSPTQETLYFPEQVSRALLDVVDWCNVKTNPDYANITQDDACEIKRIAQEYKNG
jgi:hypothetical protein